MITFNSSFNWLAVLKDLAAGMPITDDEHCELHRLASEWPTCACGQLCASLPRLHCGAPKDEDLYELGIEFCDEVDWREWPDAIETFQAIEARTTELLAQQPVGVVEVLADFERRYAPADGNTSGLETQAPTFDHALYE